MGQHEIKKLLHNIRNGKLKRQPTEWEKIFGSYTSHKVLIARIYREVKKLFSAKINEPVKKWATELNRTYAKQREKSERPKNT
jgi:hypothetical protein